MRRGMRRIVTELARRIEALIPAHPEILTLESAWGLFKVDGFQCADLNPSLGQAGAALALARARYRKSQEEAASTNNETA